MGARQICLELPGSGCWFEIELLEREAPRTCQAIWEALPIEAEAFQARRSGKELFMLTDPIPYTEAENATSQCSPGDVFYVYLPVDWEDRHDAYAVHPSGLYDIAFIYGADALLRGPEGPVAGNLFGRIRDHAVFAAACEAMWLTGSQRLALRRSESA